MAKKKTGGPARQAETGTEEVDLAELLRREGVVEDRIPAVISLIRTLSDAQAGESAPPPVPMPPRSGAWPRLQLPSFRRGIAQQIRHARRPLGWSRQTYRDAETSYGRWNRVFFVIRRALVSWAGQSTFGLADDTPQTPAKYTMRSSRPMTRYSRQHFKVQSKPSGSE